MERVVCFFLIYDIINGTTTCHNDGFGDEIS